MTDEMKKRVERLYHKVRRLNAGKIATVGVGKAVTGKEVFVVYTTDPGASLIVPKKFDGYSVMLATASKRA